jgi:hypothetical protein
MCQARDLLWFFQGYPSNVFIDIGCREMKKSQLLFPAASRPGASLDYTR